MDEPIMLTIRSAMRHFQFRAAAIIRRNGYVLIHRSLAEDSWSLPGGRVELGESGATTLEREVLEELGVTAEVGPLAIVIENFFRYGEPGRLVHEIGFYYPGAIPASFPFHTEGPCHRVEDGGAMLEFKWVRNTPDVLAAMPLFPAILCDRLPVDGGPLAHLVVDER